MPDEPEAKYPIKAAKTSYRILESLEELNGAGISELAAETDLPKSSIHNHLSTLREMEYVAKEGSTYRTSLKFLSLGTHARSRHQVYEIAKSEVDELADNTGELANLLVEEHGRGVYLYSRHGDDAVNVDARIGHRVYLHSTALGKAILAHRERDDVESILDRHGMPAMTDETIQERDALFNELETIHEQGIAFDRQERLEGLHCVAAPILDKDDTVKGAISVSGPVNRLNGERYEEEIPSLLRKAVNVIELNMAYS